MSDDDLTIAILRELAEVRRRTELMRLLLGAILAVGAVSLALLLVMVGRGV